MINKTFSAAKVKGKIGTEQEFFVKIIYVSRTAEKTNSRPFTTGDGFPFGA